MSNRLMNEQGANYYDGVPLSKHSVPRKVGDRTIRSSGDIFGAEALDRREQENSLGYRVRKKLGIELPGGPSDNLRNEAAREIFVDKLVELNVESRLVKDRVTPLTLIFGSSLSAVTQTLTGMWAASRNIHKNPLGPAQELFSLPFRVINGAIDQYSQAFKESNELKKLYHSKSSEYLQMYQGILAAERRDWQSYRLAEMDRAYLSQNRQEWFFLGNALAGLYQALDLSVGDMDRAIKVSNAKVVGSNQRALSNIGFNLVDWAVSKLPK